MPAFLAVNPPARRQFIFPRRGVETGCVVVHTFEAVASAYSGAELIRGRTDRSASYHAVADPERWVHLIDWTAEAAQDGTGSNRWAVGISFMTKAHLWPSMNGAQREGYLTQGALAACTYAIDLRRRTGKVIPPRRISKAESDRGVSGFLGHGDRDPDRRTDPGHGFPWARFLELYAYFGALNGLPTLPEPVPAPAPVPVVEEDEMLFVLHDPTRPEELTEWFLVSPATGMWRALDKPDAVPFETKPWPHGLRALEDCGFRKAYKS